MFVKTVLEEFTKQFYDFLDESSIYYKEGLTKFVKTCKNIKDICNDFDSFYSLQKQKSFLCLEQLLDCDKILKKREELKLVQKVVKKCMESLRKHDGMTEDERLYLAMLQDYVQNQLISEKVGSFCDIPFIQKSNDIKTLLENSSKFTTKPNFQKNS